MPESLKIFLDSVPETKPKSDTPCLLKYQHLIKKYFGHRHNEIVTEFKESLKMHMWQSQVENEH